MHPFPSGSPSTCLRIRKCALTRRVRHHRKRGCMLTSDFLTKKSDFLTDVIWKMHFATYMFEGTNVRAVIIPYHCSLLLRKCPAPPPPCPCPCPPWPCLPWRTCLPRWPSAPSGPHTPPAPAPGSCAGRAWTRTFPRLMVSRTLGAAGDAEPWRSVERTRHESGGRHRGALSPACPERAAADAGPQTTAEHAVVALSPHSSDQRSCFFGSSRDGASNEARASPRAPERRGEPGRDTGP